jgi:hypothetical protein
MACVGCAIKQSVTQDGTVFDVVDMEREYADYVRWLTTLAEASARLDALKTAVTEVRHLCESGAISNEQILEVLDRQGV